jgi:hypothetical protein
VVQKYLTSYTIISITDAVPIFMKLMLAEQQSVKNTYTEFHENPITGLVAHMSSQTDGWVDIICT